MTLFDRLSRVALATVGALVLSTLSVAAAIGPAQTGAVDRTVIASIHDGVRAHG
ncbi:hypothetical protein [Sphingosinicella terrae]|uniref:hypothetical protein n=1 Tax=Sphingosinicella terrae TaxID=2172047 RepID=UPI0013B3597D|nr:hypothetical protein [Sphingosinicella terrae]